MARRIILVSAICACLLFSVSAPGLADDKPQPVTSDPVSPSRRSLFLDNEAMAHIVQGIGDHSVDRSCSTWRLWPANNELTDWGSDQASDISNTPGQVEEDYRPVAASAGRLLTYKHDSSVRAFFRCENSQLVVEVQKDALLDGGVVWVGPESVPWKPFSGGWGKRSVDVAVADLDGYTSTVQDDNGKDIQVYFDEILVAATTTSGGWPTFQMNVLEVGQDPDHAITSLASDSFSTGFDPQFVSVAVGDFNGDNKNEFAVAVAGDENAHMARLLCYEMGVDDKGNRFFNRTADVDLSGNNGGNVENMDITAGDFDGDGQDELCIVQGTKPIVFDIYKYQLSGGADPGSGQWTRLCEGPVGGDTNAQAILGDLRVASGLLLFNPPGNFDFDMRQIVVAFSSAEDADIHLTVMEARNLESPGTIATNKLSPSDLHFHPDLAVGNFVGHGVNHDQTSPQEQVMVSYVGYDMGDLGRPECIEIFNSFMAMDLFLSFIEMATLSLQSAEYPHGEPLEFYPWFAAVAAPDLDGDTWLLGTPAHAVVDEYLSTDYCIQEPPKHVDYLPLDSDNWSPGLDNWEVVNISAMDDFYASLALSADDSLSSSTTQTSSWDLGQSASFSFEAGFDIGVASASVESKTKLGWDYEGEESHYNKNYSSVSVDHDGKTEQDDMLIYRSMRLDVWRYPVFGYDTGDADKPLGCYELVFPSIIEPHQTSGLQCSDWFQPTNTNHNILSYPDGADFGITFPDPSDIADYSLTNPKANPVEITGQCINDPTRSETVDTNSGSWEIKWTDSTEVDAERSVKNTTTFSEEVTVKASGHFEAGEVSAEASYSFDTKNSWGKNTNRESEHTASTGIGMERPSLPIEKGGVYKINSAAYFDKNGTLNLDHGVIFPDNVDFWQNYYNMYPDPGLNLPYRFDWHPNADENFWTLAVEDSRMKARGIFLRENTKNQVTGNYDFLGMSMAEGDQVRVCARVHNYALMNTGAFRVRFDFVPVDASLHEMDEDRTVIGFADVAGLGPQGMQEVFVVWDTTGLYQKYPDPTHPGEFATYRIYVVVDPDNDVSPEVHDWKDPANAGMAGWTDDQGRLYHGNNEGFWPNGTGIDILPPPSPAGPRAPVELSLHEKSLAVRVGDRMIDEDGVALTLGRTYPLRAIVNHSAPIRRFRHVVFREGDPADTCKVIGDHLIFGSSGNRAVIWGEWTPRTPGEYDLHVQVREELDDPIPGNTTDTLHVTVTDGGSAGGGGDSSGCFINTLMH